MPADRFRAFISVQLILVREGKVLLQRRHATGYQDGWYGFVSGHLDGGEPTTVAMAREAKEEANLTLDPQNLHVCHVMHRFNPDREYIDIFLTTDRWEGEPTIMEPNKCDDLSWFPLDALPDQTIDYIKKAVSHYRDGQTFSEFGWN